MRGKGTNLDKILSKGETKMICIIEIDRHDYTQHNIEEGGPPSLHEHDPKDQKYHLSS